jgi:16S rRNA processing protein RimM
MERPIYYPIGQIRKPFGTNGLISVNINEDIEELIFDLPHFFVFMDGQYLPYFIDDIQDKGDIVVKLDIIDSPQLASQLSGKKIYVTQDQISEAMTVSVSKFGDIEGYMVYDDETALGKVEEVIEYPSQLMLKINYNNNEKLLPLVDEFLINIDQKKKIIVLHLPEGLLEL